ncbi:Hypothetical protein, putative [Bodo saltans]|uniref:Uncharacterized protein n=1 Tax=Bodo saltans TaxID=75058 RepID=A0A0S4J0Z9_BODSA|nr:Hypothetical protein, putative [Bodo saltans]|eukprot:CUG01291.1 Hypothetical protein, putative [Bodo saltans]
MEEAINQRHLEKKKIDELRALVAEKSSKLDSTNTFVLSARAYVKDFPTENILLKLERRVESVKDQVKQTERIASQHRAGIEAYYSRLSSNQLDLQSTLTSASELLDEIASIVNPIMQEELSVVSPRIVLDGCESLISILYEREEQLKTKSDEVTLGASREHDLTKAATALQLRLEDTIPQLDEQKGNDERDIRDAWEEEGGALKLILNRLYTIHKEQAFHLQRGTHIKKDAAKGSTESEIVLSTRHSHLASEVNKGRSTLADLREELALSKKQIDSLRVKARESLLDFESEREEKEKRLSVAKRSHANAQEENVDLRDVKSKLYERLQDLRELPQQTPRAIS